MNKVCVIGILDDGPQGLPPRIIERIKQAELLIGGERHLEFFPAVGKERLIVKSNLKEIAQRLAEERGRKNIVVLASGDPLFYGIGKYLVTKLGRDALEIIPSVSSMQLAFARIKESWEDATLCSVHAKNIDDVVEIVRHSKKVGMFTDDENTPAKIAATLLKGGVNGFRAYVCENLCGTDEQIIEIDLADLPKKSFGPLNVLILIKNPYEPNPVKEQKWTLGIPEEQFYQRQPDKGLITKTEVRVISLAKMCLTPRSVVWDIGAGSGSVSIESALVAREGIVYAIEKNAEDAALISKNVGRFGATNIQVINGIAPQCLDSIEGKPDAIFIGGTAGSMFDILKVCKERMDTSGRIVVNVATVENLYEAMEGLKKLSMNPQATLIQISRSKLILNLTRFEALNPVYIIWAEKIGIAKEAKNLLKK